MSIFDEHNFFNSWSDDQEETFMDLELGQSGEDAVSQFELNDAEHGFSAEEHNY